MLRTVPKGAKKCHANAGNSANNEDREPAAEKTHTERGGLTLNWTQDADSGQLIVDS